MHDRRVARHRLRVRRLQPARSDAAGRARAAGASATPSIARRSSSTCAAAWRVRRSACCRRRPGRSSRTCSSSRTIRRRARALLDEAGYPDPDGDGPQPRLRLSLKVSTNEFIRLQAAVIQQDLRQVGIELDVRSYEFATLYADVLKGNFQLFTLQWVGVLAIPTSCAACSTRSRCRRPASTAATTAIPRSIA